MTVYSVYYEYLIKNVKDYPALIKDHEDYNELIKEIPESVSDSEVREFCAKIDGCDFIVLKKDNGVQVLEIDY